MGPPNVVIADDHTMVLEAFRILLRDEVNVVGTASNGRELLAIVRETQPDVVITDIAMPVLNGIDACMKLLKIHPELKIIFLTVNRNPEVVAEVVKAGAKGYLLKSSAADELVAAIRAVVAGAIYITPLVTEGMIGSLTEGAGRQLLRDLTVRQREILQLLSEGRTMKQIAELINVSPRTVAFHKYRIMKSLGVKNNADLLRFAIKSGLVEE